MNNDTTAAHIQALSTTLDEIAREDAAVHRECENRAGLISDTIDCEFGSPTPEWHRGAARARLIRALAARFA